MAIRTRRRARFRRATSGTQNLTTLIYNILKEQQAARKSALLAAFDANMRNANYESTYGGQPVDVGAVEAFYNQMIAAYPEGTTERDRLTAELAEFRVSAADRILSVYADAYNNGTYAFGEKVDLKSYLAFLRESKAAAPDEATKMKYTSEEFIVNFNDIHDDMKARSASAGSLANFYRRQLKLAEEMGITKDSKTYRNIQSYLATASKQAAADAKQDLRDRANKIIVRRAGLMSNALEKAFESAQREGRITNEDAMRFYQAGSLDRVKLFFGLDPVKQRVILAAAGRAGVMLGDQPLTGSGLYDLAYNTKDELRLAIGNPALNAADRAFFKDLLTSWDNDIIRPAGLSDDVERAVDSGVDLVNDSYNALGNPSANIAAYQAHARRLSESSAAETAGSAVMSILNGEVPFPDEFGGKTMISELTPAEVSRLSELYSGELFVSGAPADLINQIAEDYSNDAKIRSGSSYLNVVLDEAGTPQMVVTDQAPANRVPFFYNTTLSDGTVVSSLAMQQKASVTDQNGTPVGSIIFDVDDDGNVRKNFITNDGYKIDLDIMESWLITNGADIFQGEDGQYGVSVPSGTVAEGTGFSLFSGAALQSNDSFAKYVSDKSNVWDGTAGGPGKSAAINDIGNRIAANISLTGMTSDLFTVDSTDPSGDPATRQGGSLLTVRNDLGALRELGIGTAEFNALMSQPVGKRIREVVGTQLFRRQEGVENRATLGEPVDQATLDQLRYRGAQAAADFERATTRPPTPSDPLLTGLGAVPIFGVASPKGPRQKRAEELDKIKTEQERQRVMAQTGSDYFFRYSQMSAPSVTPAESARASYTGSSLGTAPSFKPTTVRPSFTPAQVEKSLVDFRAGERAPLNISSSTATSR